MLTKRSFLEIFIVNLLFSSMCRSKLIENESFLRSSRYFKHISDEIEEMTYRRPSSLPTPAEAREIQLQTIEPIIKAASAIADLQDHSMIASETTILPAITTISSTEKTKVNQKMERKIDNIDDRQHQQQFFYAKRQNPTNFYLNRTSKYYINYRQAYGIRYDPNKIRRSFNYVKNNDTAEEEPFVDGDDLINVDVVGNDVEMPTVQSEKQVVFVTDDEAVQTSTEPTIVTTTTESGGDLSYETTEMSAENSNEEKPTPLNNIDQGVSVENVLDGSWNGTNSPAESNATTNIMKPSRVQAALQFINTRVKEFIKYGLRPGGTPVINRVNATAATGSGQRFLNLFNVIKFDNVPCATQLEPLTPLNGTCYHKFECDQLGGVAVDECAGGFGVCCIFQFGCGGVTRQNISYFKSPDFPAAATSRLICTLTVELWPNVNQVLIEFIFFELKPPIEGSCSDDQFIVSGQSSNSPIPILCGVNSGMHMYVDVESSAERKLYLSVLAASVASRAFNIRVSQLQTNVAPQSCLQYFTEPSGFVQTFNYEDASQIVETRRPSYFNNLNYAICIRRVPEYCVITYRNEVVDAELPFQLTNVDQDGLSVIPFGQAGAEIYNCADDYVAFNGIRLCGDKFNDASITEDFTVNAPVTDYSAGPILIPVRSNSEVVGRGFKLYYEQQPCQIE